MKIALVSYWCIPYSGGVSTHVLAMRKGLEKRGHEVDVLSHNETGTGYHVVDKGRLIEKQVVLAPIIQRIQTRFNEKSLDYDPWLAGMQAEQLAFQQALSDFSLQGYDIIHAQDVISAISVSQVKPASTPLVVTLHGMLASEWRYQGLIAGQSKAAQWAEALDRYGSLVGDRVTTPSHWLKQQYDIMRPTGGKMIEVIPYGFDTISFLQKKTKGRLANNRPEGRILLACPARLDQVKGHEVLLNALHLLLQRRSDWMCWLIGEGPQRPELERLTQQLNLQHHVQFLGHRQDMAALLNAADIVIIPSIHDNFPFTVMEAQVSGKPVIASDAGGIPEMIADEENGLLFIKGRADMLFEKINTLLNEDQLRKKIANQARKHGLQHWSLDSVTNRTIQLYQEALQLKRGYAG